jgi:hypothetical protein
MFELINCSLQILTPHIPFLLLSLVLYIYLSLSQAWLQFLPSAGAKRDPISKELLHCNLVPAGCEDLI